MSMAKHVDKERLERLLDFMLSDYERTFGLDTTAGDANLRLTRLIKCAYEKTGKKVVVLIDEYDAPLLDVVHEKENLGVLRNIMRNFYSPLKACDPYLKYVFLTGITKFSQLSIFSELNNIKNISMDESYAAICGITEDEMLTQMKEDMGMLAAKLNISPEEVLLKLKGNYDGYHFTYPSPDLYNPFSLLNAFADGKFGSYWFGSGTPTYLIKMLGKFGVNPSDIGPKQAKASIFDAPTETMTNITPLLYQSGYITIKDYNKILDFIRLIFRIRKFVWVLWKAFFLTMWAMRPRKPPLWLPIFFMIFRTVIWILPCVVCRLFCLPFLIVTMLNMRGITSNSFMSYSVC